MNEIYSWLRIPITLFFSILATWIIYAIFMNSKKEKEKIVSVKKNVETKINRGGIWSSPKFNNSGFFLGIMFTLFAISSISRGDDIPLLVNIIMMTFGMWIMWNTPVIHLTAKSIEFQPLLTKILFTNFKKRIILFDNIQKITKITRKGAGPFAVLKVYTKDSKKFKLYTHVFNSEIGNALYEIIDEKITKS